MPGRVGLRRNLERCGPVWMLSGEVVAVGETGMLRWEGSKTIFDCWRVRMRGACTRDTYRSRCGVLEP